MMETRVLNDEIVDSFEKADKAWIVWDEEVSGFGVRMLPSGVRSWIVGYWGVRPGGKKGSRRLVIGRHGEMPVEEARRKAREILARVASGDDPDGRSDEPVAEPGGAPDAAAEEEPVGRSEEPAAGAVVEPDAAAAPAANEPAEAAPGTAADNEPAVVAVTEEEPAGRPEEPAAGAVVAPDAAAAPAAKEEPVGRSEEPAAGAVVEPDAAAAPPANEPAEAAPGSAADNEPAVVAVTEEEPAGRSEEPAAGVVVEPDAAAAPAAEEETAEAAPGAAADNEPAALAMTEDGEEYDRETGEIVPAGSQSGATGSFDEDLDFEGRSAAREPGPEPAAGAGDTGVPAELVEQFIVGAVHQIQESPGERRFDQDDPPAEAPAPTAGDGEERPVDPRDDEDERPASQDREHGDMAESQGPEIPQGGDRQEQAEGADGPQGEASENSMPKERTNMKNVMTGAARVVARLGRKERDGEAAGAETEGAPPEPAAPPRSDSAGEAAPGEARDPKRPPFRDDGRMAEQAQRKAASEEEVKAAKDFSNETVASLAKNLDGARAQIDRIEDMSRGFGPRLDALSNTLSVSISDARRRKRRRVQLVLAAALLAPVLFAAGAAVQSQLPFLPRADPSMGWRDHIWEHYGSAFTGCYNRARKEDSGRVKCEIEVRAK